MNAHESAVSQRQSAIPPRGSGTKSPKQWYSCAEGFHVPFFCWRRVRDRSSAGIRRRGVGGFGGLKQRTLQKVYNKDAGENIGLKTRTVGSNLNRTYSFRPRKDRKQHLIRVQSDKKLYLRTVCRG